MHPPWALISIKGEISKAGRKPGGQLYALVSVSASLGVTAIPLLILLILSLGRNRRVGELTEINSAFPKINKLSWRICSRVLARRNDAKS